MIANMYQSCIYINYEALILHYNIVHPSIFSSSIKISFLVIKIYYNDQSLQLVHIHPSIHPSINRFYHSPIHPFIRRFIHQSPSIHRFNPSIHRFIHPTIHLSITVHLSSTIHPSIHPSIDSYP